MSILKPRRKTRQVMIGDVAVGGDAPISVQSMTNTKTEDLEATIAQIKNLEKVGCEIVRVAVPGKAAVAALPDIIAQAEMPVVADIHFDYKLGLGAVEAGVHALRINPGNIGARERVETLFAACKEKGIPIRVGVNSGSLEKDILEREGHPTAEGMVESAMRHVELLDRLGFEDVILSLKASDVAMTVEANRLMAEMCDLPFHLGITEAGTVLTGSVRSSVGLGVLLAEGIGDTIRVSLAGPVEEEVRVGREILKSLGLRHGGVTVIACPTCGRCQIDVQAIAEEVERKTAHIRKNLVVAVMGCAVNGPGEAREADVGIAGGGEEVVMFSSGDVVCAFPAAAAIAELLARVSRLS
ncbi:MAG: flavodoxin-dependent (E)-4-hydroxy-3-methylbut-2-enyl-diphosphate synthase [Candidatus Eisenbacteria sp.]|nr:flavodoxin-dependent (E)-4-hydroxy-3-methylbut-2-enyl-diphosphate synthase [Candidatus Eisenbacteria bacterium]